MSQSLISNLIDDFLKEIESVRRYSINTVNSYKKDLSQFLEFLNSKDVSSINEINEKRIRLFLVYLNQQNLSKSTISRKLSSLRSFFDFVSIQNEKADNPAKKIPNPKFKRKLPSTINLDSYDKIIRLIGEDGDVFRRNLNTAIFELLYGCSLRVSELCSLKVHDVDPANYTVKVLGKGSKYRIIPMGRKSAEIIKQYLSFRNNKTAKNFFIQKNGNPIDRWYVYRLVKKYIRLVSDIEQKSPHVLRHSSATEMLNRGADLMAVKEILGHVNLSTTQIYTHVSVEQLKKSYKSAHPKS